MDILTAMEISSSGLRSQRARLNVASMNLANVNTTRTIEGGPYKAKSIVFAAEPVSSFFSVLEQASSELHKVEVTRVIEDDKPFKEVYDPSHPDADENGVVRMPNVDVPEQMVDILSARRAYEANVAAVESVKNMALRALEISGR
ncbi:MAG: flagellar basal body rod protein FlgC [Thermodesulfobacteriota bacterium]